MVAIWRFLQSNTGASISANVAMTNALVVVANVITGVVTARLLGADGRGELAALLLWPQFLGYAFSFALPTAVMYHVRNDPQRKSPLAAAALLLGAIGGLLASLIGVFAAPLLLQHVEGETLAQARWLMGFAAVATLSQILVALIQAQQNFRLYNQLRYASTGLTLIVVVAFAAFAITSPFVVALAYLVPPWMNFGMDVLVGSRQCSADCRRLDHTDKARVLVRRAGVWR